MVKHLIESNRGSGRTIGNFLLVLGRAVKNPGKIYKLVDHYEGSTSEFYRVHALYIKQIASKLDLKEIEVIPYSDHLTIKSSHYGVNVYNDFSMVKAKK